MSSSQLSPPPPAGSPVARHPLLAGADRVTAVLDDTAELDPTFLTIAERREYLLALDRQQRRLATRQASALAVADDVAADAGARSPSQWLAWQQRVETGRLGHAERLGKRLAADYVITLRAWAAGDLSAEHANAVADSLDELPAEIPGCDTAEERADLLTRAERELVECCADYTPKQVRRLGRRILEVVAPEVADEIERRLLEREERRARKRTRLAFRNTGQGTTKVNGELPDHHADLLTKLLDAYANPRRPEANGLDATGERRPLADRRGQAFCSLIEHLAPGDHPSHGGTPVQIIVTLPYDQLAEGVGAATLDTGQRLSATAVRRLACEHGVIPAVLDGAGEVLDLGRWQRLFNVAQCRAHAINHPECQAEGCTIPAAWCEAHHKNRPWARGGRTDLRDLAFLCPFHHHRAHDPAYETTWSEAGQARFHRRT